MPANRGLFLVLLICVTAVAQQQTNIKTSPAPPTSASSGKQMYEAYCASCHGPSGKGDGPAASALKTPPADLTTLAQRNGGTFPNAHVQQAIRGDSEVPAHGSKDMPVWGPVFRSLSGGKEAQVILRISNLTKYIESLQQK